eukprot:COSAG01_NODE_1871_length_9009_cov_5.036139_13_plen_73_part_00
MEILLASKKSAQAVWARFRVGVRGPHPTPVGTNFALNLTVSSSWRHFWRSTANPSALHAVFAGPPPMAHVRV